MSVDISLILILSLMVIVFAILIPKFFKKDIVIKQEWGKLLIIAPLFFIILFYFILDTSISRLTYYVAETESPQKVYEVQKFLNQKDIHAISFLDYNEKIIISVHHNEKDSALYYLINSDIIDENIKFIGLDTNRIYFSNEINNIKNYIEKWCEETILKIDGVNLVSVTLNIQNDNQTASVFVQTDDDLNQLQKINNKIEWLFQQYPKNKLNIVFDYYTLEEQPIEYRMAIAQIESDNYEKALELLQKLPIAKEIIYGHGTFTEVKTTTVGNEIEYIKKIIEINKKISKNPTDYNLYLQKGDLLKDSEKAFDNYTKAIELNPKSAKAYEKCAYLYCPPCEKCIMESTLFPDNKKIEIDTQKETAIKDLEKAVELSGGNDVLFASLAYHYELLNKPEEAQKWKLKIKNKNVCM